MMISLYGTWQNSIYINGVILNRIQIMLENPLKLLFHALRPDEHVVLPEYNYNKEHAFGRKTPKLPLIHPVYPDKESLIPPVTPPS